MKKKDQYATDQLLVQACCAHDQAAWRVLFERHEASIRKAIRKALGRKGRDPNLVDELCAEVRDQLYEKQILAAFETWRGSLDNFLAGFAAKQVEHYFQKQKRRRAREVLFADVGSLDPAVAGEGLDAATLDEFLSWLTPVQKRYFMEVMLGTGARPPGHTPLSERDKKLVQRIQKTWEKFQKENL